MATDPDAVNKMLDELARQDGGNPEQAAKPVVQDASALLEQATKPPVQPAPPAAQPQIPQQPSIDPQKFGQVINDNAQMRAQIDRLQAQIESLNKPEPVQAAQPVNDGGWGAWADRMVGESADDSTWMADPKSAVKKTIEQAGRELANHVGNLATARAWEVGVAMQLDNEFGAQYPDLMSTEIGQIAVRTAIGQVVGDQRFQRLMRDRKERSKALGVVAKLAYQQLGRIPEVDPLIEAAQIPTRKTVYAERQGARPTGGPANMNVDQGRQQEAMDAVITEMSKKM